MNYARKCVSLLFLLKHRILFAEISLQRTLLTRTHVFGEEKNLISQSVFGEKCPINDFYIIRYIIVNK